MQAQKRRQTEAAELPGKEETRPIKRSRTSDKHDQGENAVDDIADKPRNAAMVLAQQQQKLTTSNGAKAERGIIERITLVNFLTHEHLAMELGPKVNFLNGANGSGKSAVLAAIIVALGGKANNTGRGKQTKDLIMDNKQYCVIKLQLANRGSDAFSPSVYGQSIIIERRMNRVGAGSYAIRTANGAKVSEKKRDLDTILDHFNIQVDNYLTWLTQDAAKEFLMNTSSTELYKFFAKGTELTRTEEMYDAITSKNAEHLDKMKTIKDSLSTLRKKRDNAMQMVQEMEAAAQLETLIDDLQKQRLWAEIAVHEQGVSVLQHKLTNSEGRVAQVDVHLEEGRRAVEGFEQEIERIRSQLGQKTSDTLAQVHLMVGQKRLQENDKRKEVQEIQMSIDDLQVEVQRREKKIVRLDKDVENEQRRSSRHSQTDRSQRQEELVDLDCERKKLEMECRSVEEQTELTADKIKALYQQREGLRADIDRCSTQANEADNERQRWKRAEQNSLYIWGHDLPEVLEAINRMRWNGIKPIGPIGQYVKIPKQHSGWLQALDVAIGASMKDFIVTDYRDQIELSKLLRSKKCGHCNVTVLRNIDKISTTGKEPEQNFLTVRRVIEVTHPGVFNALVINSNFERVVLFEDRKRATDMFYNGYPDFVERVLIPDGYSVGSKRGGLQIAPPPNSGRNPRFQTNVEDQLEHAERRLREMEGELKEKNRQLQELEGTASEYKYKQRELQDSRAYLKRKLMKVSNKMDMLQEALNQQEESSNILAFQEERRLVQHELQVYRTQVDETSHRLIVSQQELAQLQEELQALNQQLYSEQSVAENLRSVKNRIYDAENNKNRALRNVEHYARKKEEYEATVSSDRNLLTEQERICEYAAAAALDVTDERFTVNKTVEAVDREIMLLRKRQQAVEQQYNMFIDDAAQQFTVAAQAYRDAKNTHKQLNATVTHLKQQVYARRTLLASLTQAVGYKADCSFRNLMARRGFIGKLVFNHAAKQLEVHANVEASVVNKDRSIKTFSGGEKSFATVCLLLSLWEAIPSPIRCLDEFDVFMDEVNRMESMKMLMTTALEMNEAQFVLITPLSVSNIKISEDVVVIRLPDPKN